MLDGKSAAKSAAIIMVLSIAGKGMGLVREMVLASYYGASFRTDAYKIAFGIPLTLYTVLFSASISVFIPVYARYLKHRTAKQNQYFVNNIFNIMAVLSAAAAAVGAISAPLMVKIYTAGFTTEGYLIALRLTLIMIPSVIFYTFSELSGSFLQSHSYFAPSALTCIPFNVFIITSIILSSGKSLELVAFGSLLAVVSQFLLQLPFIAKVGYRFKRILDFRDSGIASIFVLMLPLLLGSFFGELNVLVAKTVASCLGEGSVSALDYADKIYNTVLSVFVNPLLVVVYPRLAFRADNQNEFMGETIKSVKFIALIAFPMTVAIFLMKVEIVGLIFQRGEFNSMNTLITSAALGGFSAGLAGAGINGLLSKAFYSFKDTRTPVIIGSITVGINILLNLVLSKFWGITGMAVSVSLSVIIGSVLMLVVFKKKLAFSGKKSWNFSGTLIKLTAASIIMGLAMYAVKWLFKYFIHIGNFFPAGALLLALNAVIGISVYCIMLHTLKVGEWIWLRELVFERIARVRHFSRGL